MIPIPIPSMPASSISVLMLGRWGELRASSFDCAAGLLTSRLWFSWWFCGSESSSVTHRTLDTTTFGSNISSDSGERNKRKNTAFGPESVNLESVSTQQVSYALSQ